MQSQPEALIAGFPDRLIALCALLPACDRRTLAELGGADDAMLERLIAAGLIAPAGEGLAMPPPLRAALGQRLRLSRVRDEIDLHGQAFDYFCARLGSALAAEREQIERNCFYHLGRLFSMLVPRTEWQAMRAYLARAERLEPGLAQHRRKLILYRAYIDGRTGAYAGAELMLERLLAEPALEDDSRLDALLALGQMNRNLNRYDRSVELYKLLAETAAQLQNEIYRGLALINQASIANELDDFTGALELALESLTIFEAHHDYERTAFARYTVALNAAYLGRYTFAEEQLVVAIRLFELLAMEAPLASAYWLRGYLNLLLGDSANSEAAYLQAISRTDSPERGETVLAIDCWLDLGFLHLSRGRHQAALDCCERAAGLAAGLSHEHRLGLIHALRGRALRALGQTETALAAYAEAMASIEKLRDAQSDDDVKISVLGTAQQVYEQALLLCLELGRVEVAFEVAERARARAFLDLLADRSPELFAAHAGPVATAAEIQAALPAGALMLAYFTTGVLPPGEHLIHGLRQSNPALFEQLAPPARTIVFALSRTGITAQTLSLDPNLLRPEPGELRPARRWLQAPRLRALHKALIASVAELLAGCQQLFIVPHGPLHHVPWLALQAPDGRYLLDAGGPAVARAPSATVLARSCLARPLGRGQGMLALGYNDPGAGLLHAEAEARAVARILGGSALVGPDPKAAGLPTAAAGLRYLHLAGHAIYRPADPLASAVVIGAGEELSARAVMADLRLTADLVSLSACTSGLSQVVPGDELLGMLRAWLSAGAASVVCALWEAADVVARLVMERFYAHLAVHGQPGIAFRDAIVVVRRLRGRELEPIFERWRRELEGEESAAVPVVMPEDYEAQPYADPAVWGTFMLIGRL